VSAAAVVIVGDCGDVLPIMRRRKAVAVAMGDCCRREEGFIFFNDESNDARTWKTTRAALVSLQAIDKRLSVHTHWSFKVPNANL
jgi:hypothetical protein